jgi:bifunctional DNA-binding transcriptional regulator/antitoxin component of YhaV-PrlF toxin-antitoxin module
MSKSYTLPVETDPDNPENFIITFPDELLESVGWKIGDTLIWNVEDDGTIILKKKDDIQQS